MEKNKPHAIIAVFVSEKEKIMPGVGLSTVSIETGGCEKCLISAVAIAMAQDEKFRNIINQAGKLANAIRRGDAEIPRLNPSHN